MKVKLGRTHPSAAPLDAGHLRIAIPAASQLRLATVSGAIRAKGLKGSAAVSTVSGDIRIEGKLRTLEAVTISGRVTVRGDVQDLAARSVSGTIDVKKARGSVNVQTVSGRINVEARPSRRTQITSVNGSVHFSGAFKGPGRHELQSHNGAIKLQVPNDNAADYVVTTFSGAVQNQLQAEETRHGPSLEVHVLGGGPTVEINTFNGAVHLRPITKNKP